MEECPIFPPMLVPIFILFPLLFNWKEVWISLSLFFPPFSLYFFPFSLELTLRHSVIKIFLPFSKTSAVQLLVGIETRESCYRQLHFSWRTMRCHFISALGICPPSMADKSSLPKEMSNVDQRVLASCQWCWIDKFLAICHPLGSLNYLKVLTFAMQ